MAAGVWTEVSARVRPEGVETVAEALQEITGAGVSIEPAIEALGPDEGYTLAAGGLATVRGYLYGAAPAGRRRSLRRTLTRRGLTPQLAGPLRWRTIREEDWAEAWKQHYEIERVGRVVIRPAWLEYDAQPGEVVVTLDPGMAFGTGQHPTTRMCLAALQDLIQDGDLVLDLGAGSGILALAAAALGAGRCVAVDTEELAVTAARSNVALNGAEDRVEVVHGSVDAVAAAGPFDLVLANISAATVSALAASIYEAMKPGAALVAGGIIEERREYVAGALAAAGLRIEETRVDGDWRTFVARRP